MHQHLCADQGFPQLYAEGISMAHNKTIVYTAIVQKLLNVSYVLFFCCCSYSSYSVSVQRSQSCTDSEEGRRKVRAQSYLSLPEKVKKSSEKEFMMYIGRIVFFVYLMIISYFLLLI